MKKATSFVAVHFSCCHRELAENKKATAALDKELREAKLEICAKQELVAALEEAQRNAQEEKEPLLAQLEDLQLKARQAEEQHSE